MNLIAVFPLGELRKLCPILVDVIADRLEHLSAVATASNYELPEDARDMGTKLLEWVLATGIGLVNVHTTVLINLLLGGRQAVEAIVQQRLDGWTVEDRELLMARHPGYVIINHNLIAIEQVRVVFARGIIGLALGLGGPPFPRR